VSARLSLEIDTRPLYRVRADVLVVPFGGDHALEHGPLAWVDWRLCGLLRARLQEDAASTAAGAAALAPTEGRLRAPWVLAVSMGMRPGATSHGVERAAASWLERVLALGAEHAAVALPAGRETAQGADEIAAAWARGLARIRRSMEVRMVVGASLAREARRGLERVAEREFDGLEVAFRAPATAAALPPATGPGVPAPGGPAA